MKKEQSRNIHGRIILINANTFINRQLSVRYVVREIQNREYYPPSKRLFDEALQLPADLVYRYSNLIHLFLLSVLLLSPPPDNFFFVSFREIIKMISASQLKLILIRRFFDDKGATCFSVICVSRPDTRHSSRQYSECVSQREKIHVNWINLCEPVCMCKRGNIQDIP